MTEPRRHTHPDDSTDLLSRLLDDALAPTEVERARTLIASCPACGGEWAELRAMRRMLRELPPVVPPRSFTLDPELYGRQAGRRYWGVFLRLGGVMAAVLLCSLIGISMLDRGGQATTASSSAVTEQQGGQGQGQDSAPAAVATAAPAAAAKVAPTEEEGAVTMMQDAATTMPNSGTYPAPQEQADEYTAGNSAAAATAGAAGGGAGAPEVAAPAPTALAYTEPLNEDQTRQMQAVTPAPVPAPAPVPSPAANRLERVVTVGTVVIFLLLAVVAWISWRKARQG